MKKRDVSSVGPNWAKKILIWLSKMLSEGDGTPSTKRVCFFCAICACIIFCAGLLCSKNAQLCVDLAKWLLTAAGGAYGITRFAEYGKGEESDAPKE